MDWIPTLNDSPGAGLSAYCRGMDRKRCERALHRGQQLPTHRALAKALGGDLTTVTRAYAEARRCGLTEARVGQGTFVAESMAQVRHATRPRDEFDPSGLSGPDAKYAASAGGRPCCAAGLNRSPS